MVPGLLIGSLRWTATFCPKERTKNNHSVPDFFHEFVGVCRKKAWRCDLGLTFICLCLSMLRQTPIFKNWLDYNRWWNRLETFPTDSMYNGWTYNKDDGVWLPIREVIVSIVSLHLNAVNIAAPYPHFWLGFWDAHNSDRCSQLHNTVRYLGKYPLLLWLSYCSRAFIDLPHVLQGCVTGTETTNRAKCAQYQAQ